MLHLCGIYTLVTTILVYHTEIVCDKKNTVSSEKQKLQSQVQYRAKSIIRHFDFCVLLKNSVEIYRGNLFIYYSLPRA